MNWKKPTGIVAAVISAILAAFAAYNGGAIGFGAAEGSSIDWIKTSVAGLGSIGAMISSAVLSWKSGGGVSPTRAAEIAALSTLAATCMSHGDAEGVRLIGQLADYLKGRSENKPQAASDLSIGGLLKSLEQKLRDEVAKTISLPHQEVAK